jgi:TonB-linked SusC/RagA family outer membrane protein
MIYLNKKLLLMFVFSLAILSTNAQRVTININNVTLKTAMAQLKKQTGYSFVFKNGVITNLEKRVTVNEKNVPIRQVVDQILSGQDVEYEIQNRSIVVFKKKETQRTNEGQGKNERKTIKGTVLDANGEPIIGASVFEKGTKNGTVTDVDGNFTISVSNNSEVEVSYIGFVPQKLRVKDGSPLNISLKEDVESLNEVVIVGYGVERKADVVGSISTVSADKLKNRSTPSVTNALTGMMPGVSVSQTSGSPGDDSGTIRIRGVGSFGATPSALILIDGIPGNLSDIHMEDIENISVLKDASTAAIYGSRAANGVILVTTKTGTEGNTRVNYNGYIGTSSATEIPQKVDTWEYAKLYNIANGSEVYSEEEIQKFKDGNDPDNYANNRYLDEMFSSAFQTGHDVSLSGGNKINKYMLSFGYLYQDGIIKKNNYTRYNVRLNLITQLWPKITLTSRVQGVYGIRKQPEIPYGKNTSGMLAIVQNSLRWPGTVPTKLQNGNYGAGEEGYGTSMMWLDSKSFNKFDKHNVSINESLEYKPIDELRILLLGAYDYTDSESRDFRSTYKTDVKTSTNNQLVNQTSKYIYKTFQATANFDKKFGLHSVEVLVGYSWEQEDDRYLSATRSNLPSDDYPEIDTGDSDTSSNSGGGYGWALQSLFGRAKYNFDERYLAEITFRYDGSSRFPSDNRYAFFPSVAIGWRISEEKFMKGYRNWIDNLKIKASFGKLGNQNIGNYPYQSVYSSGYNYPFGSQLSQGVAITTSTDPTLRWESTRTSDIGVEGSLWHQKLTFDLTYFYRKTTGILFSPSASVSSVFGFNLSQMNMGKLQNQGIEIQLGHYNKIRDFEYHVLGNVTYVKNKVLSLGLANVTQNNGLVGNGTYFVDYPMNIYYGYKTDGVFLNQEDIDSWSDQSSIARNPQIGDIRYVDVTGDNKVTSDDRVVLGSRIPKYSYGLTLGCDWKNFDFSAQLQGVANVKGYLSGFAGYAFFGYGSIQRWQADGYFNPENPTRYPAYPRLEIIQNQSNNTLTSDFWVRNASYLRIKNIQFGYTLPDKLIKKIGVSKLHLYVQCENPLTIHHFPEGWDPEINTEGTYYPILKTYTFGLNINF